MKFTSKTLKGALLASTVLATSGQALAQSEGQEEERENIEEIEVTSSFIPDEKRNTSEVANILDADAFKATGDGDIAVALTRVTGLSLFQGKFVFVRGLGERYSSVLIDGSQFPSTDPLRRVVALDILPTSLVENVLVQKTYSPEYPGEFGGGVVSIRTKAIPDEFVLDVSFGANFNTVSTFATGFTYDSPDIEFTTFGGDARNIPQGLLNTPFGETVPTEAALQLPSGGYSVDEEPNHPNGNASITLGNSWDVGDEGRIGLVASGGWSTDIVNKNGIRTVYQSQGSDPSTDYSPEFCATLNVPDDVAETCGRRNTEQTFSLNGMISLAYEIDADNLVKFTTIALRNSVKESLIETGSNAADPGTLRSLVRNDWIETLALTNQVSGEHFFNLFDNSDTFGTTQFNWRANYSRTDRDAPLRREYGYGFVEATQEYQLLDAPNENQTSFSALDDDNLEFGVDFIQQMTFGSVAADFKFGGTYIDKERSSAVRRFRFRIPGTASNELLTRVPEIIFGPFNLQNGITLFDNTAGSDQFTSSFENYQVYGALDLALNDRLRISGGLRYEDATQTSNTFELVTGLGSADPINLVQSTEYLLPSATLTYELFEDFQIRLGYSQTVSRPDLRELANSFFLDPERDILVIGNGGELVIDPQTGEERVEGALQPAELDNYDLRLEYYFGAGEQASIGVFYKEFTNPIEQAFGVRGSNLVQTFENADAAELFGIEAEIEKNLYFQDWFDWDWLGTREFYVKANGSWIDTEVELDPSNTISTNTVRQLQGQSEWLGNLQFGFEDYDTGERLNIALNYTGERIFTIGTFNAPDTIERPPLLLNLTYKREVTIGALPIDITFTAQNLLDDDFLLVQPQEVDGVLQDLVREQYDIGATFGLDFTIHF